MDVVKRGSGGVQNDGEAAADVGKNAGKTVSGHLNGEHAKSEKRRAARAAAKEAAAEGERRKADLEMLMMPDAELRSIGELRDHAAVCTCCPSPSRPGSAQSSRNSIPLCSTCAGTGRALPVSNGAASRPQKLTRKDAVKRKIARKAAASRADSDEDVARNSGVHEHQPSAQPCMVYTLVSTNMHAIGRMSAGYASHKCQLEVNINSRSSFVQGILSSQTWRTLASAGSSSHRTSRSTPRTHDSSRWAAARQPSLRQSRSGAAAPSLGTLLRQTRLLRSGRLQVTPSLCLVPSPLPGSARQSNRADRVCVCVIAVL